MSALVPDDLLRPYIEHVKSTSNEERYWLTTLWRARYGYTTALPSIEEMAHELYWQRNERT